MANEITTAFSLQLAKGAHREQVELQGLTFDQTGVGAHKPIVDVGTVEEVLSVGDVATPGLAFFQNLDAANFVEIGPEAAGAMVPLVRLAAGKWAFLPLVPTVVLRANADTAAVKLLMLVTES